MKPYVRHLWFVALLLTGALPLAAAVLPSVAQEDQQAAEVVFVVPIEGMIDPGLVNMVKRSIGAAEEQGASAIVFEVNTPGGRVDSATEIRDAIFQTPLRTIAYINYRATSAGALVSLACQSIVVAPGSSIGAAAPVVMTPGGSGGAMPGSEKEVSFVRTEFVATAERNNHNALLAKAMVDKDAELYARVTDSEVEIVERSGEEEAPKDAKLVIAKDKLLSLSAKDALKYKLAQHQAASLRRVLELYDLGGARIARTELMWSERLASFFTHPIVSGLLLTLGFLGILYELKVPGWGVSGSVGLICLGLFFGAHLLVGLAEWVELLLFVLGVGLIIAEVFFIPGFGVAGISGGVCLLLAVYLALVKSAIPEYSWELEQFRIAMYTVFWFVVSLPIIFILTWKLLPRTPFYARIVQVSEERADLGFTAKSTNSYLGKVGETATILRPAGRARFEGRLMDVVAEGEFIPSNTRVKVIDVRGNRVVVVPEKEVKES